eukprot:scaffold29263_cov20-Prasinocladus_malaysianus.AAC.1
MIQKPQDTISGAGQNLLHWLFPPGVFLVVIDNLLSHRMNGGDCSSSFIHFAQVFSLRTTASKSRPEGGDLCDAISPDRLAVGGHSYGCPTAMVACQ